MMAAIETVRPAARNPDSTALVLFAKRTIGLIMFLAPLCCSVRERAFRKLQMATVGTIGYLELGGATSLFAGTVS